MLIISPITNMRKRRLVTIRRQCKWVKVNYHCHALFSSHILLHQEIYMFNLNCFANCHIKYVYPTREQIPSGTGFYSLFLLNLEEEYIYTRTYRHLTCLLNFQFEIVSVVVLLILEHCIYPLSVFNNLVLHMMLSIKFW